MKIYKVEFLNSRNTGGEKYFTTFREAKNAAKNYINQNKKNGAIPVSIGAYIYQITYEYNCKLIFDY